MIRNVVTYYVKEKRERIEVPESNTCDKEASELFNNENFSDFTLIVDGKRIPVHKVILRGRCEHFSHMFDSGMQETTSKELIIEDFSYEQVLAALEVIYKGSCDINPNNAVELLEIANFYKLVS